MARKSSGDMVTEIVDASIVSNKIAELIKKRKMTKFEFAQRVGVSYRHGNRIISNKGSEPSLLLAVKIAEVLDAPVMSVFNVEIKKRRVSRSAAMVVSA